MNQFDQFDVVVDKQHFAFAALQRIGRCRCLFMKANSNSSRNPTEATPGNPELELPESKQRMIVCD